MRNGTLAQGVRCSSAAGVSPGVGDAPVSRIDELAAEAATCTRCELYRCGTQTVFGDGPADADVVLVGEQPGDKEDLAGEPFVGPAGRILDQALGAAGIDRDRVYVTNAVKHFRWEAKGKARIHKKPGRAHVKACKPWLDAELEALRPTVVVCLGATAAQALLGPSFKVTASRGEQLRDTGVAPVVVATVHPSSILRGPPEERDRNLAAMVDDLGAVVRALG
jgi:uracil-DNA glycosylase